MAHPDIILGDRGDWLYIRHMTFKKAGDQEPEHAHDFGHYTAVLKGRALFNIKGKLVEISAPHLVWIEPTDRHQITALEDDTQCACIHDTRQLFKRELP